MNKKIIALAIAAAVAAPMAAHAGVSAYGKINTGIGQVDNGTTDEMGVLEMDSRLGFKGEEDLGNGMKAFFKMEASVDIDEGDIDWSRDHYFGLKGGFGAVKVGQYSHSYKGIYGGKDIFADSIGDVTGTGTHGDYEGREDNGLQYSNKFGAMKVSVDWLFTESQGDDGMAASVEYSGQGMKIGAAVFDDSTTTAGATTNSGTRLAFQMKLGAGKLNVLHEMMDSATAGEDDDVTTVQYGMNLGKNMVGVSYTTLAAETANSDSEQLTVAYHVNLSKKTKVAFAYSTVSNDTAATNTGRLLNLNLGTGPAAGQDVSVIGAMVTHKF